LAIRRKNRVDRPPGSRAQRDGACLNSYTALNLNGLKSDAKSDTKKDHALRHLALPFVMIPGVLLLPLAGCNAGYSPNTYASTAAQQEATVLRGTIIGVRQVMIAASGAIGAAAGGAAGGVAGAQVSGGPVVAGLGAVGGALAGGIGGTAAAQAISNTKGWEYIVQEDGDKLVSVTQTSKISLPIGLHVLVISDSQQARIVPDYTVQIAAAPPAAKPAPAPAPANGTNTAAAPNGAAPTEVNITPLLQDDDAATPLQVSPGAAVSDPTTAPADSAAAPAATPATAATPAAVNNVPQAPASANPAATTAVTPSASGKAAAPAAVSNQSSATATPSAASPATSVQGTPGAASSTPPASSPAAATP
jgi:outer membrane lipoprotein SlyB